MTLLAADERRRAHELRVFVSEEQIATLRELSKQTRVPLSAIVREAITAYLRSAK